MAPLLAGSSFTGGLACYLLVNIPFVITSFLLAWKHIPKDDPSTTSVSRNMSFRKWFELIDAYGVLLFTVGLVSLLVGLLSAKSSGQISFYNVIVGLIGFVGLGAFVRHELKANTPFIPLRTFAKYPAITWINVQFMIVNLLFTLFLGFLLTCKSYVISANFIQGCSC